MAKKIIVANWKMNPQKLAEAKQIFSKIKKGINKKNSAAVIICPPAVFLSELSKIKGLALGAQDVFYEEEGSYTGALSPSMVFNTGARSSIIGHSEVRARGESDEIVNKKIKACLKRGLTPIVCVGERVRNDDHQYFDFVKNQITADFAGISKARLSGIIIAYEPIWAIGKNAERVATPEESLEMTIFIKKVLSDLYDPKSAATVKVLYGGSVSYKNAQDFLIHGGIDGLLVGRDSLNSEHFLKIINNN
ncbi:MAG: triose-phosphate isomerase [Candidatus Paceibacterota bacterium]|jgi:triosephosphate isomerase